jgi:hypothetical protein
MPLPYGLDSIAPSSMSALTAEKLEKFRVGSQTKSRFQIEKEEKEGGACYRGALHLRCRPIANIEGVYAQFVW